MKRLFLVVFMFICLLKINGQITLEHQYPLKNNFWGLNKVYLDQSGYKYFMHDKVNRTITLYNLDHSIFKNISYGSFPTHPGWYPDVLFISEKLFDTDNDVDFVLNYFDDGTYTNSWVMILNENGSAINGYTKCILNGDYEWSGAIFNDENNAKMMLISFEDTLGRIYNLPGKLPCLPCSGSTTNVQAQKSKISGLKSFPNPANKKATIEYQLPENAINGEISIYNNNGKVIKIYKVDNKFNSLIVNTSEMENGIYYYDLRANNKTLESKKMLIIK